MNLFIQGNICEKKRKEITRFSKKVCMKVNLHTEFNRAKYDLNHKSHIYEIKTMT